MQRQIFQVCYKNISGYGIRQLTGHVPEDTDTVLSFCAEEENLTIIVQI